MDPGDPDEPSREELESRVEQLEETVSKMLPDRRGVIKGLGAAAIGAGVASSGASGQSAAGQVGTASNPVDVEGAQGNFDSVNTEELFTKARGPSVVVHVKDDGTIVADGPNNQIASGDFSASDDVRSVIQSAIDEGGHVLIKPHSSPYPLNVGGQDALGNDLCLQMRADTDLEIGQGAVLEYANADTSITPPDTATLLVASGISNFRVRGRGKLDAGYHRTDQPDDHRNDTHVIKIGEKEKGGNSISGTACNDYVVKGVTLSGGCRHGIEVGASLEDFDNKYFGLVKDCVADDAAGDDDFCAGGPVWHATFRDCVVENRPRTGSWGNSGFEADDGPRDILFEGCRVIDPVDDCDGFAVGKTHPWADTVEYDSQRHRVVNCFVEGLQHGVVISHHSVGEVSGVQVDGLNATNCDAAVRANPTQGGTLNGVVVNGGQFVGCDSGVEALVRSGASLDIEVNEVEMRNVGEAVTLTPNGEIVIEVDGVDATTTDNGIHSKPISAGEAGSVELTVKDTSLDGPDGKRGIFLDSTDTVDVTYGPIRIETSEIENYLFVLATGTSITATEMTGDGVVRDNISLDSINNEFGLPNSSVRQHLRTFENGTDSDFTSVVPAVTKEGVRYWDDGTNTSSGTKGERRYLNGGWVDIWTA